MARCRESLNLNLSTVRPGFIIGDSKQGIAHPRDFLWRFVASAVSLGVYDDDRKFSWVTVSTVDSVAKVVVRELLSSGHSPESVTLIKDTV